MQHFKILARRWLGAAAQCAVAGLIATCVAGQTRANDASPIGQEYIAFRVVPGFEEPLLASGPSTRGENAALEQAIRRFRRPPTSMRPDFPETAKPFAEFLVKYPTTAWRLAIQTNLGLGYYRSGYFSRAIAAFSDAWQAGQHATDPRVSALADRAAGELARMHSRIGDSSALEKLLAEMSHRPISGPATELVTAAQESLWVFRNDPGKAYLCGPMALRNLLVALKADERSIRPLLEARSGPSGFTLAQVSELADAVGLKHKIIHRGAGEPIPIPSVVNWKVNHYAAIVAEKDGRYQIQDPTFSSGDLWMTRAAIDDQTSGYFLIPSALATASAWRVADANEAHSVYGKGYTLSNSAGATGPDDPKAHAVSCSTGMCVANAHLMLVSLNLTDTPVGYRPAKGPSALVTLTYNQREAFQPATFSFFNVGPKWNLNLLSWIQDDPQAPGQSILRYEAGGGAVDYKVGYTYDTATGQFSPELQGGAVLLRTPARGTTATYELRLRDGSKYVYGRPDGSTSGLRRVFLTSIVDPAGNALVLSYDSQMRLTSMIDATGGITRFEYGGTSGLSIVRITDPFGRFASLTYTSEGYLQSITDVAGMQSWFTYVPRQGLVTSMTTPYGTTRFTFGTDPSINARFLTITDPLGLTERLEFRHQASGIAYSDATVPSGVNITNGWLDLRNTFYWDKHMYSLGQNEYTKAWITHWLHGTWPENKEETSGVVESTKAPLEGRVWYSYPGSMYPQYTGTTATPVSIARILDDGSTQAETRRLDQFGTPVETIDPTGRLSNWIYDASGVDLLQVKKRIGGTLQVVEEFAYNAQHRPTAHRDAAGQVTQFTYNSSGQRTGVTDPLGRTTTYAYDGYGRLVNVINSTGRTGFSVTYDLMNRVASRTDSEGYTLLYAYDALDRLVQISYPDTSTTQYTYRFLDLAAVKDRLGRVTKYTYDANRRLIKVEDPLGLVKSYAYHPTGVLKSLTDPNGNTTLWDVDLQSRPIAKHSPNGTIERYTYEATTSRPKSTTDAQGQTRQLGYTVDGQVASITYLNARRPTPNVTFTYDSSLPRLTSMQDGIGTTRYTYIPVGSLGAMQVAGEDGPYNSDMIGYQYDAMGRVVARTVDTTTEGFEYDSLGRVSRNANLLGDFKLSYLGDTKQLTSQATAGVGTTWSYLDNQGDRRLSAITNTGLTRGFTLETTAESRVTGVTQVVNGGATQHWVYSYDADDRLTGALPKSGTGLLYTYDTANNLSSIGGVAAAYDSANQVVLFDGRSFVYDASGNLVDDGERTYQWDAENRLVGIGYKANAGQFTAFRYDGLGRRLAIVETSSTAVSETRYLWCGGAVCQARNATDTTTGLVYQQGISVIQGARKYYFARDHLGSVRDVLDAATGAAVSSYDFDPYGKPIYTSLPVDFGFAGMFIHKPSRLNLTIYRAYDPVSGRWLSRDPLSLILKPRVRLDAYWYITRPFRDRLYPLKADFGGAFDGLYRRTARPNLYEYARDNPVSYWDPLGLDAFTPGAPFSVGDLSDAAGAGAGVGGTIGAIGGVLGAIPGALTGAGVGAAVGAIFGTEAYLGKQVGEAVADALFDWLHPSPQGHESGGGADDGCDWK